MACTIAQAMARAAELQAISDTWRLDCELLLAASVSCSRSYLHTRPERILNAGQLQCFDAFMQRRRTGEPIAYILGYKAFWDMQLKVDRRVLIPRAETELLVEVALALLRGKEKLPLEIADLGTGSGAIALALARQHGHWQVTATDISSDALDVARDNAASLTVDNISFHQGCWGEGLGQRCFDLVVSNPPYVAEGDPHLESGGLEFEPRLALVAEEQGLADIRTLAQQCRALLNKDAWLLIEHGYQQRKSVATILEQSGYQNITGWQDLDGLDRVSGAQFPWQTGVKIF
jgi:release factor glutamine methyltransferase